MYKQFSTLAFIFQIKRLPYDAVSHMIPCFYTDIKHCYKKDVFTQKTEMTVICIMLF